jgi:hypothetical protein
MGDDVYSQPFDVGIVPRLFPTDWLYADVTDAGAAPPAEGADLHDIEYVSGAHAFALFMKLHVGAVLVLFAAAFLR